MVQGQILEEYWSIVVKTDALESRRTDCLRPQRYDSNQWSADRWHRIRDSHLSSIAWSTVSNAADSSNDAKIDVLFIDGLQNVWQLAQGSGLGGKSGSVRGVIETIESRQCHFIVHVILLHSSSSYHGYAVDHVHRRGVTTIILLSIFIARMTFDSNSLHFHFHQQRNVTED